MNPSNEIKKLGLTFCMLAITACSNMPKNTNPKNWEAIGGSKADAIVELSYQYNIKDDSRVNEASAYKEAKYRCENWGYKAGSPFNSTKTCLAYYNMRCIEWKVKEKFQCT